jgi:protocatechuate 3,4-dioxygenase beta subunit
VSSTVPSQKEFLANAIARGAMVLAVLVVFGGIPSSAMVRAVIFEQIPSPPPDNATARDANVAVVARDASGDAVGGAEMRVFVLRREGDGIHAYSGGTARTAPDGRARVDGLPRGEAWVTVEALGHARGSSALVLAGGERAIDVVLGIEHHLEVDVRDERGAPLAGAEIEVAEADPLPIGARTGQDGMAHVGRLEQPPWAVTARAPGYDEVTTREVREGGGALPIVLRKLGAIAVSVVDDHGEGVPGARVSIASPSLWPARVADADAHGAVRISSLTAGTYALRATAGDRATAIDLGEDLARGQEKRVTLRLVPSETVAVRVTADGATDEPVPGARVSLAESGVSPFPVEATTDASGRARLGPIARGPASLETRAEGYVTRSMSVPEPLPAEVAIALPRAGVVEGRITDARGFPVDGATLEVVGTGFDGQPIDDDPRRVVFAEREFSSALAGPRPLLPAGELGVMPGPVPGIPAVGAPIPGLPPAVEAKGEPWVTASDGTYQASPASPGRVRVLVHHPQYVDAVSETTTLPPGGKAKLDVVLRAGGTVEGRVLDARDSPAGGARVVLAATRGTLERVARTASDGTFGFAAVPGDVVLLVSPDDEGSAVEVRAPLTVPDGSKRTVTLHLPPARDPLPVVVRDDRGFPVDDAQVTAVSLDGDTSLHATAFTNTNGDAVVGHAKGLSLRLEVTAPGHAPLVQRIDGSAASAEITLAPAESVTGVVQSTRGDPIEDAEIVLYTPLGARHTRSRAGGSFELTDLGPGTARLVVQAPGFAAVQRAVTLEANRGRRPQALDRVELAQGGTVEGVVLDERGDPLAGARVAQGIVPTYLAVGATPAGVAVTDARGRFRLTDLPEGTVTLEAFAADVGRDHTDVRIASGETTRDVRITLAPAAGAGGKSHEPESAGSLAVTLGESGDPPEVVVVAVAEGSEAERAGLAPGDALVSVGGEAVSSMEAARARLNGPLGDDVLLGVRKAGAPSSPETLRIPREPVRR